MYLKICNLYLFLPLEVLWSQRQEDILVFVTVSDCIGFLWLLKQFSLHTKTIHIYYNSAGLKSEIGLTELKIKMSAGLNSYGGSRGELIPLPLPASRNCPYSFSHGLLPPFKDSNVHLSLSFCYIPHFETDSSAFLLLLKGPL